MVVEGFISGTHKSPYQGYSVEFAAHREYVPGDDTRHIDWRLFARQDRLYIKQFEEETNLRTHILLDCSHSMAYPAETRDGGMERRREKRRTSSPPSLNPSIPPSAGSRMTKFEYAATLAASLAYLLVHQQDACGLLMFDHAVREQVPPISSPAQLRGLIELIERNGPDGGSEMKMLFTKVAEQLKRRGLIVVISDLLTGADDVIAGLQRLRYTRHDVIVLHVLDEDELSFPFQENTQFEGLEGPQELLIDPQSLRASYLEIVQRFISRIRAACVDHRIDYRLLSTRDPLDAALSSFLAARMHSLR
jgi:uncharacterized protein (DUF58 family)